MSISSSLLLFGYSKSFLVFGLLVLLITEKGMLLSLVIFLFLKSTLSDTHITSPASFDYCLHGIYFPIHLLYLLMSLYSKCVSYI